MSAYLEKDPVIYDSVRWRKKPKKNQKQKKKKTQKIVRSDWDFEK